eukprot:TRINITY_DN1220_c0_g2_i2.p1 TRINITY_DN1220_c0_g2~~TRINITY_DN1220_c0_g2_i2.p1  ORF type:complete len:909 (-),score=186.61 TRINITY_DN1220_c0_g2_i2:415-3141(-)
MADFDKSFNSDEFRNILGQVDEMTNELDPGLNLDDKIYKSKPQNAPTTQLTSKANDEDDEDERDQRRVSSSAQQQPPSASASMDNWPHLPPSSDINRDKAGSAKPAASNVVGSGAGSGVGSGVGSTPGNQASASLTQGSRSGSFTMANPTPPTTTTANPSQSASATGNYGSANSTQGLNVSAPIGSISLNQTPVAVSNTQGLSVGSKTATVAQLPGLSPPAPMVRSTSSSKIVEAGATAAVVNSTIANRAELIDPNALNKGQSLSRSPSGQNLGQATGEALKTTMQSTASSGFPVNKVAHDGVVPTGQTGEDSNHSVASNAKTPHSRGQHTLLTGNKKFVESTSDGSLDELEEVRGAYDRSSDDEYPVRHQSPGHISFEGRHIDDQPPPGSPRKVFDDWNDEKVVVFFEKKAAPIQKRTRHIPPLSPNIKSFNAPSKAKASPEKRSWKASDDYEFQPLQSAQLASIEPPMTDKSIIQDRLETFEKVSKATRNSTRNRNSQLNSYRRAETVQPWDEEYRPYDPDGIIDMTPPTERMDQLDYEIRSLESSKSWQEARIKLVERLALTEICYGFESFEAANAIFKLASCYFHLQHHLQAIHHLTRTLVMTNDFFVNPANAEKITKSQKDEFLSQVYLLRGRCFVKLCKPAEAQQDLKLSLQLFHQTKFPSGSNDDDEAYCEHWAAFAELLAIQQQHERALVFIRKISNFEEFFLNRSKKMSQFVSSLMQKFLEDKNRALGLECGQMLLQLYEVHGMKVKLTNTKLILGRVNLDIGNFLAAFELFHEVTKDEPNLSSRKTRKAFEDESRCLMHLQRYHDARDVVYKLRHYLESSSMTASLEYANILRMCGAVAYLQNNKLAAETNYEKSLQVYLNHYNRNHATCRKLTEKICNIRLEREFGIESNGKCCKDS